MDARGSWRSKNPSTSQSVRRSSSGKRRNGRSRVVWLVAHRGLWVACAPGSPLLWLISANDRWENQTADHRPIQSIVRHDPRCPRSPPFAVISTTTTRPHLSSRYEMYGVDTDRQTYEVLTYYVVKVVWLHVPSFPLLVAWPDRRPSRPSSIQYRACANADMLRFRAVSCGSYAGSRPTRPTPW